jgi:hypothetical protein
MRSVYFKAKGKPAVIARASFIRVVKENPSADRPRGVENDLGKFYYGFCNLVFLKEEIPLSSIRYFNTLKAVRNDVPGACIIEDVDN